LPSKPEEIESAARQAFDPELFRLEGHALVDRMADYLGRATRREPMPVLPWKDPAEMAQSWPPVGDGASSFPDLFARFLTEANHLHHPRYIGHQVPPPLPMAALCDLLASFTNNGMAVYEMGPSGTAMERRIIEWMAARLGFPSDADGVLTSGGSVANLTALLAARNAFAERLNGKRPAFIVSEHAHYSVTRSLKMLGFAADQIERAPVDECFRMRADTLEASVRNAEARGCTVIGISANACTTPTGVYDPLDAIGAFCAKHGLWFHVDGAHGASACLSSKYRGLLKGIERADSVVWDVHKMMLMPALVSAIVYRNGEHSYLPFSDRATYLLDKEAREEWYNLAHRTLECTKRSISLKVYAALQVYGEKFFGDYVESRYDLAGKFAQMVRKAPRFELAAEPEANIVCFRYKPGGAESLDALQLKIRSRLIESGAFYIVQTGLPAGRFLRVTITNPLTDENDLAQLLEEVRSIGESILRERRETVSAGGS
jgi:L-2,4-diaminobutyrate decarboxylase